MRAYSANDARFRADSDSATIQNAIDATREGAPLLLAKAGCGLEIGK